MFTHKKSPWCASGPARARDRQQPDPDPPSDPTKRIVAAPAVLSATVVAAAMAVLLYFLQRILLPFAVSGILAYVLTPLIDSLAVRTRLPRSLFATAALVVLIGVAALIAQLGLPALVQETLRVASDFHGAIEGFARALIGTRTLDVAGISLSASQLAGYATDALRNLLGNRGAVLQALAWSVAGVFGFIMSWVLLGYFLLDAPRIGRGLFWLIPPPHRPFAARVWRDLDPVLRRYFVGVSVVVLYASVVAYVGLGVILGLHHALFLALLTGLLEVIPFVGPVAAAVIAGVVAVQSATGPSYILGYVIYAIALRISIDQLVGPIVLGRAAQVPPIVILFCFLAGGTLFGMVGVILAVPVTLAVKTFLLNLYDEPWQ